MGAIMTGRTISWKDSAGHEYEVSADTPFPVASYAGGTGVLAERVQGNAAHDAVDVGDPVKIGGTYSQSPSAVSSGDRTNMLTDRFGNTTTRIVSELTSGA